MSKFIKATIAVATALVMVFSLAACVTGGKTDPNGNGNGGGDNKEVQIDLGDKNNPTFTFVTDGELAQSTVSKQDTVNKLQATDDFGRSFGYMDGEKTDKDRYVGLFYFTWHGWHGSEMNGVYDVTKLIDENPDALWNVNGTSDSPVGKYHHWGEPLYGYYNSKDPWVIRKHMELFILSGIDFIAFDCTNGFDYIDVVEVILPIMDEMRLEGWDVPQFMFYLNTNSRGVIKELYYGRSNPNAGLLAREGIYKKGYYQELWFAPDGKPKIAAITNPASTNGEGALPAPMHVVNDPEILAFFDFWESQWPNKTQYDNGLPWMSWTRPQPVHTDTINVGVAQHNLLPFSDALLSKELSDLMWGRGYHYDAEKGKYVADHSDRAIESALNFEDQWSVALEKDVKFTFVTGWNEWVAIKSVAALGHNSGYVSGNRVFFVDTVNKEYSRDIEMMKDGYADNVMMSLFRNSRTYTGKEAVMPAASALNHAFDIKTGLEKWSGVQNVYYDITGISNRNYRGYALSHNYTDDSIKNDIAEIRVTHDGENIYFLIVCTDDIVINAEAANFMNLLIDVEGQGSGSWYGYDYIINRQSSYTGESSVERYNYSGDEVKYNLISKANFTIGSRYMQYKVPKAALGIADGEFTINFKVADNVTEPENMQSYYITGDVAPVGRINYIYKGN